MVLRLTRHIDGWAVSQGQIAKCNPGIAREQADKGRRGLAQEAKERLKRVVGWRIAEVKLAPFPIDEASS